MRYAGIDKFEISNGKGIGMSLFVQGCPFHCDGCFNQETWNPKEGLSWESIIENEFIYLAGRDYIKRVSILGGEPMADYNYKDVVNFILKIKDKYGDKLKIWLYTGYTFEELMSENSHIDTYTRGVILTLVDVIVDGRYEKDKKDVTLAFRGSSNQRIIDCKRSIKENKVVLLEGISDNETKIQ